MSATGSDGIAAGERPAPPAPGGVGLLIIDLLNPMDFEGAEAMATTAMAAAQAAARLRVEADGLGVPTVYVNDNFGQWHSDRERIVDAARAATPLGRRLVETIAPRPDDYFVIKPQFSGFYATHLQVLLPKLGVNRLVLTGLAADICVLFTAADAHMRAYGLWAPADAVASSHPAHTEWTLAILRKSMGAQTASSRELRLSDWVSAQAPTGA
ncbi:MAG: cysteine hydrolase [Phenylobacterium zucineum]|nr:MAG: cysteine hydrolase [Phenylobacterium zucineum]